MKNSLGFIQQLVEERDKKHERLDKRIESKIAKKLSATPVYFLELLEDPPSSPNPAVFHRTESTSYNEILDYIINSEIFHYFSKEFKENAIELVNEARKCGCLPEKDKPIILLYGIPACRVSPTYVSSCEGYRITLATAEQIIDKYKEEIEPYEGTPADTIEVD